MEKLRFVQFIANITVENNNIKYKISDLSKDVSFGDVA